MSAPLMGSIAYGADISDLQILGYVLVFVGSVASTIAMVKAGVIRSQMIAKGRISDSSY
jgi:hypothetical protein